MSSDMSDDPTPQATQPQPAYLLTDEQLDALVNALGAAILEQVLPAVVTQLAPVVAAAVTAALETRLQALTAAAPARPAATATANGDRPAEPADFIAEMAARRSWLARAKPQEQR